MSRKFTPEQQQAIDYSDTALILSAGAGCGKTTVLTERYLRYLQQPGVQVENIAAITFTDKAATEMRQRIRSAIRNRLRTVTDPDDASYWKAHLRAMESPKIFTIHGFCTELLKTYQEYTELQPGFTVLTEIVSHNIRKSAVEDTLLNLLETDATFEKDLSKIVVIFGWNTVVSAVQGLVKKPNLANWLEASKEDNAANAQHWLQIARTNFPRDWLLHVSRTQWEIQNFWRYAPTIAKLWPSFKTQYEEAATLWKTMIKEGFSARAIDRLHTLTLAPKGKDYQFSNDLKKRVTSLLAEFRKAKSDLLNQIIPDNTEELTEAAAIGQHFIRVALESLKTFQTRKLEQNAVDFDDMLVMAVDLLKDKSQVQQELHNKYQFIMLDEAQDTDPKQFELIKLLCNGTFNTLKLFVVGDVKQSIYRFRGANVDLFQALKTGISESGHLQLTTNFRSHPGILRFVNSIFQDRLPDYEPLQAGRSIEDNQPVVEFLWTTPNPGDKIFADGKQRAQAKHIAFRLTQILDTDDFLIFDRTTGKKRRVQAADVTILFRATTHIQKYEEALRDVGLDYYLLGGRSFFAQQEIYDLLNTLRTINQPEDQLSLIGMLRSPMACINDDSLVILARQNPKHDGNIWLAMHDADCLAPLEPDQRAAIERIRQCITHWREMKDHLRITELIQQVLRDTGFDASLQFEPLADRKQANLWKLIEIGREFDRTEDFDLGDFIERLADLVREMAKEEEAASSPENANVITMMTIHKSKGLEFPVVVLADINQPTTRQQREQIYWQEKLKTIVKPPLEGSEEIPLFSEYPSRLGFSLDVMLDAEEADRVFYVACTRAESYLILSGFLDEEPERLEYGITLNTKIEAWCMLLGKHYHLDSGLPINPAVGVVVRTHMRRIAEIPDVEYRPTVTVDYPVYPRPHRLDKELDSPTAQWGWAISNSWLERRILDPTTLQKLANQGLGTSHRQQLSLLLPFPRWQEIAPLIQQIDWLQRDNKPLEMEWLPELEQLRTCVWYCEWQQATWHEMNFPFLVPWPDEPELPSIFASIDYLWRDPQGGYHAAALNCGESRAPAAFAIWKLGVEKILGEPLKSVRIWDLPTSTVRDLPTTLWEWSIAQPLYRKALSSEVVLFE
ncbi:MAG: UvrD-helicase domain-containing protein [Zavarzinella sp.]